MNATNPQPENDELIQKLSQIVLENLNNEQFGVSELAEQVGMNRSHLHRKIVVLTKKSISQFIREIRLTEALKLLKEESVKVSEVAYTVGFNNPSYFNKCFHDQYGFPPGEAKHMNLKNMLQYKKREKSSDKHRFSFAKKYAFIAIFFFLVIVSMVTVLILKRDKNAIAEKSIAVLPFYNDSPDQENEYFINGTMETILNNLCKIKDLRVVSRSSVEQFRDTIAFIPDVAKKLEVSYVLAGSMQKYGNHIRITLQLIDHNDKHLWSEQYDREIRQVEELFTLQSEIAQLVAGELKAVITPEEKELIEKTPTANLTAYDFYQRGREEHMRYYYGNHPRKVLQHVETLYHTALEYDSTFALVYFGLAQVYMDKHFWDTYLTEEFLDSVLILADVALSIDNKLADAYTLRGRYYREKGNSEQALEEYNKAIKLNPNNWSAYFGIGESLYWVNNLPGALDNYYKAASLNHGRELHRILFRISLTYGGSGFIEQSQYYAQEFLKLTGDTVSYYILLSYGNFSICEYEKATRNCEQAYAHSEDTTDVSILSSLGLDYLFVGQNKKSFKYFEKCLESIHVSGVRHISNFMHRIGYAYWQNGYFEESEKFFNEQIKYCKRANELGRLYSNSFGSYYDLAGIYAFRGEKDNAYENLRIFNKRQRGNGYAVALIKVDPLFDNIRDEPEFQQIVHNVEAKYQAEHERVRQWLEENDR